MDGDLEKLQATIGQLDGKVDALGWGDHDALSGRAKNVFFTERQTIDVAAQQTPIVDGTELKMVLEKKVVFDLDRQGSSRSGEKSPLDGGL